MAIRSLFLTLALTFVMADEGSGQRRFVIWGGGPACEQKGSGIAPEESISCSSIETPRGKVSVIHHDGLNLGVAFVEEDRFIVLGVHIRNGTPQTIQFNSEDWGAAHFKRLRDGTMDRKPLAAETSVPNRDLLGNVNAAAAKDSAIDTYIAGSSKTARTREIRRADGTRTTSTVLAPDEEATRLASERVASRQTLASDAKQRYRAAALSGRWLAAGKSTKGLVYFRRFKRAGLVVFSLSINDTTYVFRLLRGTAKGTSLTAAHTAK